MTHFYAVSLSKDLVYIYFPYAFLNFKSSTFNNIYHILRFKSHFSHLYMSLKIVRIMKDTTDLESVFITQEKISIECFN
jgi:hypothetical protein